MDSKVNKKVKYPDNLLIKRRLKHGDQLFLSQITGYKHKSVCAILNGRRPMPDVLAKEITTLLRKRSKVINDLLCVQDNPTQN